MRKWLLFLACVFLPATPAMAEKPFPVDTQVRLSQPDDVGMISIVSPYSVRTTSERLMRNIEAKGLKIAARIDHQANAQSVKLALRPSVLVIFGDPQVGTQLMHENQTIGLDLPMKYLIWEAVDHQIYISWNNPYYLAQRHGIPSNFTLLSRISQTLLGLAKDTVLE